LIAIFETFCAKAGYRLAREAREKLAVTVSEVHGRRDGTFGNARFAGNIFERALERQAGRIINGGDVTTEVLSVIEAEDIEPGVGTGL
jgi:hypothetical protein